MPIPQQLAPTVGPAHGGFEFLKGSFEGLKGYVVGRMTKSHRDSWLYIDDAGWGPKLPNPCPLLRISILINPSQDTT